MMNDLKVIEYRNIRVLTTQQLAEVYEADAKVISNNFNRNRERYLDGKHFICLEGEGKRTFLDNHQIDDGSRNATKIYLWTEKGAFLHAKSLNTDKAWEIYDHLVDTYFEVRKPLSPTEQLRLQQQAILEVDEKIEAVDADLQEFKRDMPLLALECQKITWAKNQKVVPLLGGKNAPAYKSDKGSLRSRVYRDLEGQLRREFGVNTYKAIKRSQCDLAIQIIEGYELPMALKEEIEGVNAQVEMFQEVISTQRGSI